ncbi:MAG: FAD-dependent monooxygenase [Burkholderiales bacterium]|nr:FAD-dependent monooxygenase [Burkholderiales bacterium]
MARTTQVPLLVVGGGLGGLTAALALSSRGIPCHVVEKSPQFGEIGAGLQIAPNASRILHRLGLFDAIRGTAVFPQQLVMMDAVSGERVTSVDLGRAFLERYQQPYFVIHRGDLLDALLAACRSKPSITLEAGKALARIEDTADGADAFFADGTVYRCQAIVGADGLHSSVRRHVTGDEEPVCEPYVAYRGAIPIGAISEHAGMDSMMYWGGPELHFVQYPLRGGEMYNQVAVFRSRRFDPASQDWGTPQELQESFACTCAPVRKSLEAILLNRRWPMVHRYPIAQWTRGRVTLLGDAAHPMLQYLAQGACQAIEDAVCLARKLSESGLDYERAFAAYQAARYLRTARVQTSARFFGDYVMHLSGVNRLLRNALLASRRADDFSALDWLYGHDA